MKKTLLIFCLFSLIGCGKSDYNHIFHNLEQSLNEVKFNQINTKKIKIRTQKNWDYIILVRPYFIINALSEETGVSVNQLKEIENIMTQENITKHQNNLMILFIKNKVIVSRKILPSKLAKLPYTYPPNWGYIFITKHRPYFIYKLINKEAYLFGQDLRSQEMLIEQNKTETN